MAAFSKRFKGAMSSYFEAGKDKENRAVFLTEVPSGTADPAAEDATATGKKNKLEVCSISHYESTNHEKQELQC